MPWYLVHTKHPQLKWKINKFDKVTKQAELQGGTSAPFTRDISDESLKKLNYKVVQLPDETVSN
jgi:hypothetical protein